jgi:hypothetical protein
MSRAHSLVSSLRGPVLAAIVAIIVPLAPFAMHRAQAAQVATLTPQTATTTNASLPNVGPCNAFAYLRGPFFNPTTGTYSAEPSIDVNINQGPLNFADHVLQQSSLGSVNSFNSVTDWCIAGEGGSEVFIEGDAAFASGQYWRGEHFCLDIWTDSFNPLNAHHVAGVRTSLSNANPVVESDFFTGSDCGNSDASRVHVTGNLFVPADELGIYNVGRRGIFSTSYNRI